MKNKILFLLLFVALQSQAQIEGYWKGQIDLEGLNLEIGFFIKVVEGGYVSTLDVPAQSAFDVPVDKTDFYKGQLDLRMDALNASYSGQLKDRTIEGTFTQHGMSFPLDLEWAVKEAKRARPQDPQPPYDYHIEEVRFANQKEGNTLVGTLTIPKGEGPFPAMVLVSGSGQQNRD